MNSHWLSYSLTDFILYSVDAFRYLLADYNQQQLFALALCYLAAISICICLHQRQYPQLCLGLLALCWCYNGWVYYQGYYQQLNGFAQYLALICYLMFVLFFICSYKVSWREGSRQYQAAIILLLHLCVLPFIQYYWLKNVWFIQYPLSTPLTLGLFSLSILWQIKSRLTLWLGLTCGFILLVEGLFLYGLFLQYIP